MPYFKCSVITGKIVEFTAPFRESTLNGLVIFRFGHSIRIFRKEYLSYIYDSICYRIFAI